MIPKKIHYCWFGKSDYPPLVKACIDSWKIKLPDWEIIKWDESNAPLEHDFLKKALKEKQYAFAADYTRIYALNKFGGVYLDTDVEVIKDFFNLIDNDFFIGYENIDNSLIGTAVIGSKSNSFILKEILSWYDINNYYLANPKIITPIVSKYLSFPDVQVLPCDYFYPYNLYDSKRPVNQLMYLNISKNTYSIHHWAYSWKPNFIVKCYRYLKNLVVRAFFR